MKLTVKHTVCVLTTLDCPEELLNWNDPNVAKAYNEWLVKALNKATKDYRYGEVFLHDVLEEYFQEN